MKKEHVGMSVCIECGQPSCGEETFDGKNGKITCYFCHEHINRANMNERTREKVNAYKPAV